MFIFSEREPRPSKQDLAKAAVISFKGGDIESYVSGLEKDEVFIIVGETHIQVHEDEIEYRAKR